MTVTVETTTVTSLRAALSDHGTTVLLDVRTPSEYHAEHIDGTVNLPLDQLGQHTQEIADAVAQRVVVICQTGTRASRAATTLAEAGIGQVAVLDGGMTAWSNSGGPVNSASSTSWTLERQVRLVAGGLVATSVLGSTWAPRLRYLAGAIGTGLVIAATLLARLPHNRIPATDADTAVAHLTGRNSASRTGR